jgi:uncharacterized protein (TIGR03083 family)
VPDSRRVVLLEADRTTGFSAGLDEVPEALAAVRRRLLRLVGDMGPEDWARPSRCQGWTVQDVVRHVRDGCRLHISRLRHAAGPGPAEPFDARRTPQLWLERTAGESTGETARSLAATCSEEARALDARLVEGGDALVAAPYGPAHWTILTAHVVWDAWLHVRDVTESAGGGEPSTPVEDRVVGLYAVLIASIPAQLREHRFEGTLALTTDDGREHLATVAPGRASLREVLPPAAADLRGDLHQVVDALAGRPPALEEALHGDPVLREPLTWLASVLAPLA